ncbi:MAG TPA: M23 family metallopeptidase [Candidatus Lumbricidophila sp.]|nr:M23 family metallopeptidase [Candidatus Lumbricidophila sp.]
MTDEFGPRPSIDTNDDGRPDTNPFHFGIDLVGFPIVNSPVDGLVIFAAANGGAGNEVRIKADNGDVFRLFHNARFLVAVGQRVTAGQDVAVMGETGQATGVHCHLQVHPGNGAAVDPRTYYAKNLSATAGSITTTLEGNDMSISFVKDANSPTVYVCSVDNGRRVGITSWYHLTLLQRFQKNNNNDPMLIVELDIVKAYLSQLEEPDDTGELLAAIKAISINPAPIVAAVTAALTSAKVTVDPAAIAAAVDKGLADNFAAIPGQVLNAEAERLKA